MEENKILLVLSMATTDDIVIVDDGSTRSVEMTISWIWDSNKLVTGAATVVGVGIIVVIVMAPCIELVPIIGALTASPRSCIVLVIRVGACALVVIATRIVLSCTNELGDGNSICWVELVILPWSNTVLVEAST